MSSCTEATVPSNGGTRQAADLPRLSVLHVATPGAVGGLERVVQSLCIGLRRRQHAVQVVATGESEDVIDRFQAPLASAGVPVHRLVLPPRSYVGEHRSLARLITSIKPQVVHTHGYRADLLAGWAARDAGVPTVTTLHGFTGGGWKNRVYERLQRIALGRFDAVAAVSQSVVEQAGRSARQRLRVIANAWLEYEAPLGRAAARGALGLAPTNHRIIGWVGRVSREKGLDVALNALPSLAHMPLKLVVVGDGPARSECERLASDLGLGDRVHWCGRLPDAARLFGAFDVFLLSSRSEGTPMVLFEAMATRTPIVATEVGGVPEVLPRGTALLVPPERPEALAQAIQNVLDSPRHATARASAARTRLLTHYDPQRWLDAYEGLYRQVTRTGR